VENDTFLRVWRLTFDLAEHTRTDTCPNHNVTRNLISTSSGLKFISTVSVF